MELHTLTAVEAATAIREKKITARELTQVFLDRCTAANTRLNAFLHISADTALKQAGSIDEKVRRGEELPSLAGVPVALKDDLCFCDAPTTCGSKALQNFVPPYNAAAVQKIIAAGGVIIGKTNLDQFSLGSTTAGSFAGPTVNPIAKEKLAGDGAAAALAAGHCLLALGSDTGGSTRIAAAYCGLFGLRPTTGLVSRYGLNTFCPSFARVGVLAKDGADAYTALLTISGYDPRDSATSVIKDGLPDSKAPALPGRLRVGFAESVLEAAGSTARSAVERVKQAFSTLGSTVVPLSLPLFNEALQAYYVIAMAEASSNLSRFDGIRFGRPCYGQDPDEYYRKTRALIFGEEGKRRSVIGTYLLSKDNFDRYYRQAQKVCFLVKKGFEEAMDRCDLIVLPAAEPAHSRTGEMGFIDAYTVDRYCAPVSLSGLPSLCIPAGGADCAPAGVQLVGRPFEERFLTEIASQVAKMITLPPAGIS